MIYLINFILTILFIIITSFFSKFFNLLDHPNNRKLHKGSVPLVGGISIYFSILILLPFIDIHYLLIIVFLSSGIILFLGALDDAIELGVVTRLISQLIACLIVIGTGFSIIDIGDYYYFPPIHLGIFGILLTVISIIGLTNALNFIDGIDGLCSGLVLIALISLFCFIYISGIQNEIQIIKLFICSVTAFLLVNIGFIPIKKIFLGDAGSMVLGFILSWFLIYYSHTDSRHIHPVLTIWCVSLPIYDLLGVIIRRTLRKINPFKSDRRHIHHILLDSGISSYKVLLLLLTISSLLSVAGGIIFFTFGPLPALLGYFILFLVYLYFSLMLSRKLYKINK